MKAGLGAQRGEPLPRMQRCAVEGCDEWAVDCPYCERCDEEVRALEEMRRREERKQAERVERHWRRQERAGKMRCWLGWLRDVVLIALVIAGLVYVGQHLWLMFGAWLMGWN